MVVPHDGGFHSGDILQRDIGRPGEIFPFLDKRPVTIQKNSPAQVQQLPLKTIGAGFQIAKVSMAQLSVLAGISVKLQN